MAPCRGARGAFNGLAVVAVDNAEVVAPAVVSLAASSASQGKQVVVADLSDGQLRGAAAWDQEAGRPSGQSRWRGFRGGSP